MFSTSTYKNRRTELMNQFESGWLLFLGNEEVGMNYKANAYPFRQDSSFLYYFGIDQPGRVGAIDVSTGKSWLFGEDVSMEDVIWTGAQPRIRELANQVGAEESGDLKQLVAVLLKAVAQKAAIHYLPPYRLRNTQKLSHWLGKSFTEIENGTSKELIRAVIAQRSIKSEEEIAEMEKAVAVSKVIHHRMMRHAKYGIQEAELMSLAEGLAMATEGRLGYPPIVTVRGETLHNHHYHHRLEKGQLILADVGAAVKSHYTSDITRTFPVAKRFTQQQREIYQIVLDAENFAIKQCQPKRTYQSIHLATSELIATRLKELGLMKGDPAEAVVQGAHALFFVHGLGHMIGLDVHDMEDLGEDEVGYGMEVKRSDLFGTAYLRLGKHLRNGFVVTVEPGIYFIPALIEQWQAAGKHKDFINYDALKRYKEFGGIRIEDNVLVTATGQRVLGPAIAKTVSDVEELRNS
ncbi:MAG: aminopeptidase P family protein [Bacteroidota bacterium]